ncbi:MAG: efflux RND transporter permease subunit, partial [Methylocystaceae bacterium]|nr:efflux RND transporter permease subunit [Methylocystaceae bacterium]
MKRFNASTWAVMHPALILFFTLALLIVGTISYQSIGRAEDPSFTIKVVIVSAIWPGATAIEMQNQVADPIEKKLQELPRFEKVVTFTKPSFTAMQVIFKDDTPAAEVPYLFYQLRKKISDIKSDLPQGLIGPAINDEYGDVDSILLMLTADGADYAQMKGDGVANFDLDPASVSPSALVFMQTVLAGGPDINLNDRNMNQYMQANLQDKNWGLSSTAAIDVAGATLKLINSYRIWYNDQLDG